MTPPQFSLFAHSLGPLLVHIPPHYLSRPSEYFNNADIMRSNSTWGVLSHFERLPHCARSSKCPQPDSGRSHVELRAKTNQTHHRWGPAMAKPHLLNALHRLAETAPQVPARDNGLASQAGHRRPAPCQAAHAARRLASLQTSTITIQSTVIVPPVRSCQPPIFIKSNQRTDLRSPECSSRLLVDGRGKDFV